MFAYAVVCKLTSLFLLINHFMKLYYRAISPLLIFRFYFDQNISVFENISKEHILPQE